MIDIGTYIDLVRDALDRDLEVNDAQFGAVQHDGNEVLMLVAGPGSGKTTILVLRALRQVFVDDMLPEELLITTFTRKAAKEVRTRWLDWGARLLEELRNDGSHYDAIDRIDLNRCRIDTLDSIVQQVLTENRLPGTIAPILVDASTSKLIFKRKAFSEIFTANRSALENLLGRYTFDGSAPSNRGEALKGAKAFCDRLIQDRVDLEGLSLTDPAHHCLVEMVWAYQHYLEQSNIFDFAMLEQKLLERLREETLDDWLGTISVLLIDEYQDTNPLQEEIYFEIINRASPLVTIVGDDDQAMYRFRGGSVELFTQFESRCLSETGRETRRIDMVTNYRSSAEIVQFYNAHIQRDSEFLGARIIPRKPEVVAEKGELGMPVLGMFRPNPVELADSLASWLGELVTNRSILIGEGDESYELTLSEQGDLGDCVLLAHSINEVKYQRYNREAETRFTGHFRHSLGERSRQVFNPRGRSLRTIENVQCLLGLLLHCLDPDEILTENVYPTNEARYFFREWRNSAISYISKNPEPAADGGLAQFVESWQYVSRGGHNSSFPSYSPALELIYKFISWIRGFQVDPEHQVWLEVIMRTISSAGMESPYAMQFFKDDDLRERSRESFIRDALVPIAQDEIEVSEDIMPSVPRDRLQMMTIHQSKGLEFPLVIVDVGSHFKSNHHQQKFLRFPNEPSNVVTMENDVESYLGAPLRGGRSPIDRTFDDLVRLYYVAYSRPQSVLMLVGCEKQLKYGKEESIKDGAIPNVALGWSRNGSWPWRQEYTTRRRPVSVDPPLLLINS